MLPILHLNGYKIANPTVLARIEHEELEQSAARLWLRAALCRGRRSAVMHQRMADEMDEVFDRIRAIQQRARESGDIRAPALADDRAAHARRAGPDRRPWTG